MSSNIHQASIPAEVLEQALMRAREIRDLLSPYATVLTVEQRRTLPKMGDKSLAFVEKAFELMRDNPHLVPPYINLNDFNIDFADAHNLTPLVVSLQQLTQTVDDTHLLAGSEAYQTALAFYNSVKQASKQGVTGAKAIYETLKARFAGVSRRKEAPSESNE
jgi:hypothetical protein